MEKEMTPRKRHAAASNFPEGTMTENQRNDNERWNPRIKLALIGFALIGGFFIFAEHQAHVLSWLPWLLLAACPLMHLFMHHGHGGHDHQSRHGMSEEPDAAPRLGSSARSDPSNAESGSTGHQDHEERPSTPLPVMPSGRQAGHMS